MPNDAAAPLAGHPLVLTRIIDAPPADVYRAWTDPELLKQWFAPRPYTTPVAELDVRPGGRSHIVMRDPEGRDLPNPGVYLEVVDGRLLVLTDAYTEAWVPSEKPFLTVMLTFEAHGSGTKYTATALHWSAAGREAHEKVGFHQGWGVATDQMEQILAALAREHAT